VAASEYAQHRVVELDTDLDQRRAADGIDPEGLANATAHFVGERLVEQREERFRTWRWHLGDGEEINDKAKLFLRDAFDLRLIGALRIGCVEVDQRGDVLHHGGGEARGYGVPVPLHEYA